MIVLESMLRFVIFYVMVITKRYKCSVMSVTVWHRILEVLIQDMVARNVSLLNSLE